MGSLHIFTISSCSIQGNRVKKKVVNYEILSNSLRQITKG